MLLSTETLGGLRTLAATALPESADVQRRTQVVDDVGGTVDTYATASTVACRVSRLGNAAEERIIGDRIAGRSAFTVFLPWDADVRESDRLVVTPADPALSTQTYEVAGVLAPTSYQVHVRCVCAREG
jgi:head-tail adaptor